MDVMSSCSKAALIIRLDRRIFGTVSTRYQVLIIPVISFPVARVAPYDDPSLKAHKKRQRCRLMHCGTGRLSIDFGNMLYRASLHNI
jgi:hypothetical protein